MTEDIRSGALHLVPPPHAGPGKARSDRQPIPRHIRKRRAAPPLALELINAKSWLAGKRANLHVAVRKKQNGEAIAGALVTARIDGAADVTEFSTETGSRWPGAAGI